MRAISSEGTSIHRWRRMARQQHGLDSRPLLGLPPKLTDDHLRRLDEASPFSAGFPKSFLESDGVRELIFGETFGLIDPYRP